MSHVPALVCSNTRVVYKQGPGSKGNYYHSTDPAMTDTQHDAHTHAAERGIWGYLGRARRSPQCDQLPARKSRIAGLTCWKRGVLMKISMAMSTPMPTCNAASRISWRREHAQAGRRSDTPPSRSAVSIDHSLKRATARGREGRRAGGENSGSQVWGQGQGQEEEGGRRRQADGGRWRAVEAGGYGV